MELKIQEKLKLLRSKYQLTQAKMAEKINISITAYQDLESSKTNIINANFLKVLEHFDLDLVEFLSLGEKNVIYFLKKI